MTSIARVPSVPPPQDTAELRERARGALLGLAVGDALGAPAENMKPSQIRARWGRIEGYVTDEPAGTDDTEYAIFSGLLLARHGSALTPAHVETAWHEWIADRDEGPFRGAGFSERGTLENLRRGLAAPISAQHRHAWSDGLAMRAAPFGVFAAGRPAEAARLVAVDGSVSHDGEGIYGGQVGPGIAADDDGGADGEFAPVGHRHRPPQGPRRPAVVRDHCERGGDDGDRGGARHRRRHSRRDRLAAVDAL
ncbi:ADP-ribosylglycohydrolase family protein, partial [Streptomyces sp. NRRL B-24085]|uniref:ADP-ribosylglycohydrolase family protein n=1 Tax=Streptomyces sp. NRRL B-24085 TaxID=1709476 RepID=UPI00211B1262